MLNGVFKLIDNWQARRLQRRVYMARLEEKYLQYVSSPEQMAHILDARLNDDYGSPIKPLNQSGGYFDQEHRYATHIWVYASVNVIAEKSSVPELSLQDSEGEWYESPLPLTPNPEFTWDECEQLLSIWLELTGNAYLYHDKEENTFWPLRPSRVKIALDDKNRTVIGYAYNNADKNPKGQKQPRFTKSHWMYDDPELLFSTKSEFNKKVAEYHGWVSKGIVGTQTVRKEDEWVPFEADEVLHFRYVSPTSDLYGMAPLCALMTNLETELFARQWNLNFFENGAIPPGVLVVPKVFPEKTFKQLKKQFDKDFLGTKNRGKPLVIQGGAEGATYTPFPGQHRDLEFLEGLNRSRDETLAAFGVPHVMVNAQMTGSHSSTLSPGIETFERIFWKDTMLPKQKMKAAVWTKHYKDDLPRGFQFAYDYHMVEALKPNRAEQAKAATAAIRSGMTIEEVRTEIWQLPAAWEGTLLLPANVIPVQYGDTLVVQGSRNRPMLESQGSDETIEAIVEPANATDD